MKVQISNLEPNVFQFGQILTYSDDNTMALEIPGTYFNLSNLSLKSKAYTIKDGDTLENIAHRELGKSWKWFIIALYNDIIDPFDLTTGSTIFIPITV